MGSDVQPGQLARADLRVLVCEKLADAGVDYLRQHVAVDDGAGWSKEELAERIDAYDGIVVRSADVPASVGQRVDAGIEQRHQKRSIERLVGGERVAILDGGGGLEVQLEAATHAVSASGLPFKVPAWTTLPSAIGCMNSSLPASIERGGKPAPAALANVARSGVTPVCANRVAEERSISVGRVSRLSALKPMLPRRRIRRADDKPNR